MKLMGRWRTGLTAMAILCVGWPSFVDAQGLVSTRGKVRIFKGGLTIEGKDLQVNDESVSLTIAGQPTFIDLNDIDRVDVRHSNVGKGALLGGGGCLAIGLIACNAASSDDLDSAGGDRGQCFTGALIWAGLFAAGGALVGHSTSDWEPVYYRTRGDVGLRAEDPMELAAAEQPRLYFAVIPPRECCPGAVGFWVRF